MNLKNILFPLSDWKMWFHSRERGCLWKPGHDLGRIAADVIHVQQCYTMLYNVTLCYTMLNTHSKKYNQMLYTFNICKWLPWNMLQYGYSYSCSQLWFIFFWFQSRILCSIWIGILFLLHSVFFILYYVFNILNSLFFILYTGCSKFASSAKIPMCVAYMYTCFTWETK